MTKIFPGKFQKAEIGRKKNLEPESGRGKIRGWKFLLKKFD